MEIFAKSHFHERGQMCLRASFYFWLWARAASLWSSARVFECEQNALWSRCPPERWIFELEMYQNYLSHRFSLIKSIIIRLKALVYEILILILTIHSLNLRKIRSKQIFSNNFLFIFRNYFAVKSLFWLRIRWIRIFL